MKNRFGDLRMQTLRIFSDFEDAQHHEGTSDAVRDLVGKARESLLLPGQQLGVWETAELNNAEHALDAGFPRLALIAAAKALAVHQLSEAEYAFGFDSARRPVGAVEDAARALLADEKGAANALAQAEENAARKLESVREATAAVLAESQQKAATALLQEDKDAAADLIQAQAAGLERMKTEEERKVVHLHEQEQALSWMIGGYSVESYMPILSAEEAYAAANDTQKTAALALAERQDKTAANLKESQASEAFGLQEDGRLEAAALKGKQRRLSIQLRESQTIRALRKSKSETIIPDDKK